VALYTLSLHDALPISQGGAVWQLGQAKPLRRGSLSIFERRRASIKPRQQFRRMKKHMTIGNINEPLEVPPSKMTANPTNPTMTRSEEHTSELQSPCNL